MSRKLKETPPTPLALVGNLFFLLDRLWCSDLFEQLVSNRRLGGLEEYRRRAVALVSIQAECPPKTSMDVYRIFVSLRALHVVLPVIFDFVMKLGLRGWTLQAAIAGNGNAIPAVVEESFIPRACF